MAATVEEIKEWFETGVKRHHTHMIIICDTFDYDDYPVYVLEGEDPREVVTQKDGVNMQKVMEVYDLREPMGPQVKKGTRVWNYGQ